MASKQTLKAAPRARTGSGRLTQMRKEGWLPSVIYGRDIENQNLKVDAKTFAEVLAASSSENIIMNLEIEGSGTRMAYLQAIQYDALSGSVLHADFRAIDDKTPITAYVPVRLIGEPAGVKVGGVLEQYVHTLEIVCLPNDLPETLDVDVTDLALGDSLHISGLGLSDKLRPVHPGEVVIVHVGVPGAGVEEETPEETPAAS